MDKAKPFCIAKRDVWEAYKRVKANQGAAGVDGKSIAAFEQDLENNLYRIWNRMSSGSYFPPAVRRVDIPKGGGQTRPLGIPTVSDRIAQTVVQRYLEPILEPVFHRTPMDIVPEGRHTMHWPWRGSDAGVTTGCWTWTSKVSLRKSTGNF